MALSRVKGRLKGGGESNHIKGEKGETVQSGLGAKQKALEEKQLKD